MDKLVISNRYRSYVLGLLFFAFTLNFLDRQLMAILLEPIKAELNLSDGQMGVLIGFAFAFLYTSLGIPLARIADRGHRVSIISISIFVWSLFTLLTGLISGYWQLFFTRIGVGIGEAGCSPASYSLIGDYFPKEQRGRAVSTYVLGAYFGVALGYLLGGWIAQKYGWRMAFFVAGTPGIVLALITKLTLKPIPRGHSDDIHDTTPQSTLKDAIRNFWRKRTLLHMIIGLGLQSIQVYAGAIFFAAFLMRSHGMTLKQAGFTLSLLAIFGGGLGVYLGGWLADKKKSGDRQPQILLMDLSDNIIIVRSGISRRYPIW